MLYISKTDDYLKILTYDKVKEIVVKKFGEHFKSKKKIVF